MSKFVSIITVNKYIIVKQITLVTNVIVAIPTFKKLPDNGKINFLNYLLTYILNLKIQRQKTTETKKLNCKTNTLITMLKI